MHEIPSLKYKYSDLEPFIDEETMRLHHTKHHQAYVDKLNAALEAYPDLAKKPIESLLANLEQVPEAIRQTVRNHGGGHYNHSLFWQWLRPAALAAEGARERTLTLLDQSFGGIEEFKKQFKDAGLARFGSGWAWLVWEAESGRGVIETTANQDTPLTAGRPVLLGVDLWEHAYYLKYQNRRADYLDAWWSVVNWPEVEARLIAIAAK